MNTPQEQENINASKPNPFRVGDIARCLKTGVESQVIWVDGNQIWFPEIVANVVYHWGYEVVGHVVAKR